MSMIRRMLSVKPKSVFYWDFQGINGREVIRRVIW